MSETSDPGYADRDDAPTTEQTGGAADDVPRPDQGADPVEDDAAED